MVRNAPLSRAIIDSIRSQETFVEAVLNMRANAQEQIQGPEDGFLIALKRLLIIRKLIENTAHLEMTLG